MHQAKNSVRSTSAINLVTKPYNVIMPSEMWIVTSSKGMYEKKKQSTQRKQSYIKVVKGNTMLQARPASNMPA